MRYFQTVHKIYFHYFAPPYNNLIKANLTIVRVAQVAFLLAFKIYLISIPDSNAICRIHDFGMSGTGKYNMLNIFNIFHAPSLCSCLINA
jgi:hypothetical protein